MEIPSRMTDPNNQYRVLLKFMDKQFVQSFLDDGLLHMNNIVYFRNYEDTDTALRGDRHEGLVASYKADQVIIKFGDHIIEDAIEKIDIRKNHEDETNIYSMTKISDANILKAGNDGLFLSKKFLKFGNHVVLISGSDIVKFEDRLRQTISNTKEIYTPRNDSIVAKQVVYLNRDEHHRQMDVFNKFEQYSWQYEWRIAFKQTLGKGPYSLKIGYLRDIAKVYETETLLKQPLKLVQNIQ